jgi:hypothetical protein
MGDHGDWSEDSLACLWSREKTARLVHEGRLTSCGTDTYGRQLYKDHDVMKYYAFGSVPAGEAGLHTSKGIAAGPVAYEADEYEDDYEADEYEDDSSQGSVGAEDDDEDEGGLDEPGDGGLLDEDDDDEEPTDAYIDRRIAVLDRQEKAVAAALAGQADLMALGQSSLGLAVGRLRLRDSLRRWLGG